MKRFIALIPPSYRRPLIFSLLLHFLLLILLLLQLPTLHTTRSTQSKSAKPTTKIIRATVVSAAEVTAQQQTITKARAAHARMQRQKKLAQQRRLVAKAAKAKEAQQLAQQKKIAEAAAQKAKKQAAAKAAKAKKEQQLAQQKKIASKQASQYRGLIISAIQNHFYKSVCSSPDLSATLSVNLDRTGTILSLRLLQSSGNTAFDRMAETAVRAAAPLPMPKNPQAVAMMQQLNLVVAPCSH